MRKGKLDRLSGNKIIQGAETPCISHSSMANHLQAPIRRTAKYLSVSDCKYTTDFRYNQIFSLKNCNGKGKKL
jgi:hypothetical protein